MAIRTMKRFVPLPYFGGIYGGPGYDTIFGTDPSGNKTGTQTARGVCQQFVDDNHVDLQRGVPFDESNYEAWLPALTTQMIGKAAAVVGTIPLADLVNEHIGYFKAIADVLDPPVGSVAPANPVQPVTDVRLTSLEQRVANLERK